MLVSGITAGSDLHRLNAPARNLLDHLVEREVGENRIEHTDRNLSRAGILDRKSVSNAPSFGESGWSIDAVDVPIVIDLYRQGRFKLDELVTRTYPLEEVETVFADMADGKVARGVLIP